MRINLFFLLFIVWGQSAFSAAKIEHWETSQGTPVYYVETKGLPMVDMRVVFDAGSARDGYQQGMASLTSTMLRTGAGDLSADDIAQRFESVGAQFGAGISRDMAWVSVRTLTEQKLFDTALQTVKVILTQPTFNEVDFQREKNRRLAGLKHREESPGAIANIAFSKAIFNDHPYANPTTGVIETVSGFTAEDLKDFYSKYYVANNAMVVIVGDLSKNQAKVTAEELISDLQLGSKATEIPAVEFTTQGDKKHIEFPSTQTHVLAGLVGMHRKDPDYFDLYVGNHILGGSGLVSQLFGEVREKRGLAYSAYSYFSPLLRKGSFIMGLQTRNDQTSEAVKVMLDTLTRFVKNGPTEEELLAAKRNITGGFAMRFDTNSKLTNYVAMIGFYRLPLDYLDAFQDKVNSITIESIKNAFQRRVRPELINIISVGGR